MFNKMLFLNFKQSDLPPEYWHRIKAVSKQRVLAKEGSQEAKKHLAGTDCLILKLGMGADRALIDSMPNLKYIGMYGTGFGRIDAAYAATKGITVCNIAGYATDGVAEFVFAALLEHLREITRAKIQGHVGVYSEASYTGTELRNKRFGVIGLGRIGGRVAQLAHAFGASVHYWSQTRKQLAEKEGVTYARIDRLLKTSDIVTLHMALNPETKGFLNAKRIKMIKPGAIIINTAPMELVDTIALQKRLKKGNITFILDHSDELDSTVAVTLSRQHNCILYPPIAYTTKEATNAKRETFVANLENFLKGKPTNKVN
jgi:glycerate dehydrogenase